MKEKINNINIQSGDLRQLIIKYFKINNDLDKKSNEIKFWINFS